MCKPTPHLHPWSQKPAKGSECPRASGPVAWLREHPPVGAERLWVLYPLSLHTCSPVSGTRHGQCAFCVWCAGDGLLEIQCASLHKAAGVSGGSSAASRRQGWPASDIAGVFLRALRGAGTDALLSLVGGHVGSGERERQDCGRERTVTGPTSPALGGGGGGRRSQST